MRRLIRLGGLTACALGLVAPPSTSARATHTTTLSEVGHLHLLSRHNFTLTEQGSAAGTIAGTLYVRMVAVSSSRVTAEVQIGTRRGTIAASGSGSYRRTDGTASFSGSLSIDSGSGDYADVHGSGLHFSGTIDEAHHDAITVRVSGTVSD
ncbi:MAG TPA: hypothetical protein VGF95_06745 [Solirubrobacteraceae bacterium]|jgi:hypothetical protein